MIEAIELTSTCRSRGVGGGPVEKVSFDVYPGQVTALLGAPGAGKSTVLRLMVELEPGGGRTLFGGRPYRALRPAVREVGLALNPDAVHPGRTVQAHLQLYAAGGGVPKPRIAEVLEVAGLSTQATVRCGRLDAGQRQRLAIAAALLGDPAALILDEPYTLDSHGMSWFHALIRAYAAQGRTVLVAATDPDTLSGTADHVVVLRRDEHDGVSRVIASRSAAEVFDERRATVVQVRSPQAARLAAALESEGARLAPAGPGALQVRGLDRARIGEVAHVAGVCLHELSEIGQDDDVFGLRPVPRQQELLPGLNRAGNWHSGVRVVPDEIEETEVVEAAAEASAEAERPEMPGQDVPASATVQASAVTVTTAGTHTPEPAAEAHAAQPSVAVQVPEPSDGAQVPQKRVRAQTSEPNVVVLTSEPTPAAQTPQPSVRAQVSQSNVVVLASEPTPAVQDPRPSVGAAEPTAGAPAPEPSPAAQTPEPGQTGGAAESQPPQEPAAGLPTPPVADQQSGGMMPSTAGSWRTQGSVAGSRWSAVKGSQAPRGSAASAATPSPASAPAPSVPEPAPAAPEVPEPAPVHSAAPASRLDSPAAAKSREVSRRTSGFGLRWGRGKPHPSAATAPASSPETVASPVLVQPAVPFTVAPSAEQRGTEPRGAGDGMTPWRAAAARASKQSQQQASVAEAAPAEQEASA
ncbi:ABC-type multidrug transport system ATPase subunit [Catenulispora sp. GP43]|uniref:ATP-binding cassette domain-containing protein n=1 Tax=Catenulispora sp. GP43 TaxID=3156263 RepID=UPI003511EC5D